MHTVWGLVLYYPVTVWQVGGVEASALDSLHGAFARLQSAFEYDVAQRCMWCSPYGFKIRGTALAMNLSSHLHVEQIHDESRLPTLPNLPPLKQSEKAEIETGVLYQRSRKQCFTV